MFFHKPFNILILLLTLLFPVKGMGEDFVKVSVVIAEPYDVLYSCFGHAALHLECPEHDLDYIFTCEGEPVQNNVSQFLLGNLKMGVFAMKPEIFLKDYKDQGRGVVEYELNLPDEIKRRLWKQMDERLQEPHVAYDFVNYGCSHLIMVWLGKALEDTPVTFGEWPETFSQSRKQLCADFCAKFPWNHLFLLSLIDGSLNNESPMIEKVMLPKDLVTVLQRARINGEPLMKAQSKGLLPSKQTYDGGTIFTPLVIASLILLVTVVLFLCRKNAKVAAISKIWSWALLALQTALGIFFVYLVCISSLPCSEWNWLIIPFNPLPLLLWRWRSRWAVPFAVICITWIGAVLTVPFICEDHAYIPLVLALALMPFLSTRNLKN